jgi:hypothetical protein
MKIVGKRRGIARYLGFGDIGSGLVDDADARLVEGYVQPGV